MNNRNLKRLGRFGSRRRNKNAVAEIIAALLLILIAVAAAAVVYTYVLNFVGNVSQNSGQNTSEISVDSFCVSASDRCNAVPGSGTSYYIVVRNFGSVSISIGTTSEPVLYFRDVTSGISVSTSCNVFSLTVPPGGTYACYNFTFNSLGISAGDTIIVKVVDPDGGATLASTQALK